MARTADLRLELVRGEASVRRTALKIRNARATGEGRKSLRTLRSIR